MKKRIAKKQTKASFRKLSFVYYAPLLDLLYNKNLLNKSYIKQLDYMLYDFQSLDKEVSYLLNLLNKNISLFNKHKREFNEYKKGYSKKFIIKYMINDLIEYYAKGDFYDNYYETRYI